MQRSRNAPRTDTGKGRGEWLVAALGFLALPGAYVAMERAGDPTSSFFVQGQVMTIVVGCAVFLGFAVSAYLLASASLGAAIRAGMAWLFAVGVVGAMEFLAVSTILDTGVTLVAYSVVVLVMTAAAFSYAVARADRDHRDR